MADLVSITVGVAREAEGLALDGLQVLASHEGVFGSVSAAQTGRVDHLLETTWKSEN